MKKLHILKETSNPEAEKLIAYQVGQGESVKIILIQDAVYLENSINGIKAMACKEDVEARNIDRHNATLDYKEILNKIIEADSVVCW